MLAAALITAQMSMAKDEDSWMITAYCPCKICTGKDVNDRGYNIMANGMQGDYGYVACNWLPFGTLVDIEKAGIFIVGDRGAKSLFGDKKHHIKHLDMYLPSHYMAKQYGVQYRKVTILGKELKKCKSIPNVITAQHRVVNVKHFNKQLFTGEEIYE